MIQPTGMGLSGMGGLYPGVATLTGTILINQKQQFLAIGPLNQSIEDWRWENLAVFCQDSLGVQEFLADWSALAV